MKLHEIKQKSKLLTPTIQIGKNGLTDSLISEVKKQIKKRNLVKIKLLRSFAEDKDCKQVAADLASKTSSALIDHVGHVIVLKRKD